MTKSLADGASWSEGIWTHCGVHLRLMVKLFEMGLVV